MDKKLNDIIVLQTKNLQNLLEMLEKQHDNIVKEDAFKMEKIVDEIKECNIEIAKVEMLRKELTKDKAISDIILQSNNDELEENYRKIRKIVNEVILQKETNELLIKQGIGYTNKMLQVLSPSRRSAKTYGATGKLRR
ncbi:flagellar protein FlgN [Haloimpatiens sp. FM7330]|uniref:flagellar protein FlgN n=1 Tax=Haloimpatiens sp. FM7330 TaxID=3298610 RepID=UPI00362A4CCA